MGRIFPESPGQAVDTLADWTSENPALPLGFIAIIKDDLSFRIGDGKTPFVDLSQYAATGPASVDATAASLASNNPVLASGQRAFEIDTGLVKIGNGTDAYNDLSYLGARELNAAGTTTQQTGLAGTSGTPSDITGLVISFEVVSRPVYVTFFHPYLVSVTNTATPFLRIRNVADGARIADGNTAMSTAAGQFFAGTLIKRIATPGSYNWKAAIWRAGAGTITSLNNEAQYEALLYAEEK